MNDAGEEVNVERTVDWKSIADDLQQVTTPGAQK
ncbi:hypothetical protein HDG35_006712 [Paraburkholderia sp. JPY681]|nr:hypothetical protein [Paraburkholderia atlantica]